MDVINLQHALPQVFAGRDYVDSDIWHQDVSFEKGNFYLIEAASGTGKSSLCSYIYGYRNDYQGIITFDGSNIQKMNVADWTEVRKRSLSMLFQDLRLFTELTAMENVLLKNSLTGYKGKEEIKELFYKLGIGDKMDVEVGKMSFGQQQRVALIRSLCQPFDFILLDEPVSHLDQDNAAVMSAMLRERQLMDGAGVIVTSIGYRLPYEYDSVYSL